VLPALSLTERQEPPRHSPPLSHPGHTSEHWFGVGSGPWHAGLCCVLSPEAPRSYFRKFIWVNMSPADFKVWEWGEESGEELDLLALMSR